MASKDAILIYGISKQAQTISELIEREHQARVIGFFVDSEYKTSNCLLGKPVYETGEIDQIVRDYSAKVCLSFGYKNMVRNRERKYYYCKEQGYSMYTFISNNAHVYTDAIGEGCIIYPGTILQPFTKIGIGTFIEAGCVIAHHTEIGSFNFIAPGAHFCGSVKTGSNCFFGGASEIVNDITIEQEVFIPAGAKVSHNMKKGSTLHVVSTKSSNMNSDKIMERMFNK